LAGIENATQRVHQVWHGRSQKIAKIAPCPLAPISHTACQGLAPYGVLADAGYGVDTAFRHGLRPPANFATMIAA
jgi:hypothetical protein